MALSLQSNNGREEALPWLAQLGSASRCNPCSGGSGSQAAVREHHYLLGAAGSPTRPANPSNAKIQWVKYTRGAFATDAASFHSHLLPLRRLDLAAGDTNIYSRRRLPISDNMHQEVAANPRLRNFRNIRQNLGMDASGSFAGRSQPNRANLCQTAQLHLRKPLLW